LYKFLKVLGIIFSIIILILVMALLFVRSPWGQDIIVSKATNYVSEKTGTKVEINRLFITFSGNVYLEGLYLEDELGDTLLYSGSLETGVAFLPLIKNGDIHLSKSNWDGLVANVKRDSLSGSFNFDFLTNTFIKDPTDPEAETLVDTTSTLPSIQLSPISIRNVKLNYQDEVLGINTMIRWDEFQLKTQTLDLQKMFFEIDEFSFNNADIDYFQYKPFDPTEEDTLNESPLPILILHELNLNQINLRYESIPDGLKAIAFLNEFKVVLPEANLHDQNILLKSIVLNDSQIDVEMLTAQASPELSLPVQQDPEPFTWPDWMVEIGDIELNNNKFRYKTSGQSSLNGQFNPDEVLLSDFQFSAHSIFLKKQAAGAVIDQLSFIERSGLKFEEFGLKIAINDQKIEMTDIIAQSDDTRIEGDIILEYLSIDHLISQPEDLRLNISLSAFQSHLKEVLIFAPDLDQNPYFSDILEKGMQVETQIRGDLNELFVDQFQLRYGQYTTLTLQEGIFGNPTNLDDFYLDIPTLNFSSTNGELAALFQQMETGFDLPEEMQFEATAKGTLNDLIADLNFQSSDGNFSISGNYQGGETLSFKADGEIQDFDLGKLFEIKELNPISLNFSVSGNGSTLEDLNGSLAVDFKKLEYYNFDYAVLELSGEIEEGIANLVLQMKHPDLNFEMNLSADLDSLKPEYQFDLDLKSLEMMALGITTNPVLASLQINGSILGNPNNMTGKVDIENGRFLVDGRNYPLGLVSIQANLDSTSSEVTVQSDFLNGGFFADGSFEDLSVALTGYVDELLGQKGLNDSKPSISANANLEFKPTPLFDQVLFSDLEVLDSLNFSFEFQSDSSLLHAHIDFPELIYGDVVIDTFQLELDGYGNEMLFNLGYSGLSAGPVEMDETAFRGTIQEGLFDIGFISYWNQKPLVQMRTEILWQNDTLKLAFDPDTLILNGQLWTIPPDHSVIYAPGLLEFRNFEISQAEHKLTVTNALEEEGQTEHLALIFENFQLHTLTSFLNAENSIATGMMNGKFVVENPFDAIGLVADLQVNEMETMKIPLGNLSLQADASSLGQYQFNLSLKEGHIDTDIFGSYLADPNGAALDLTLNLQSLQLSLLEVLSDSAIVDTKGYISGNAKLNGNITEPSYDGRFEFHEAGFLVSQLNAGFVLENESIRLDESAVYFDQLVVRDYNGNQFSIDGEVDTKDFANIGMNLKILAADFEILNSTRANNDLFYGDAKIDLDMTVTGNVNLPIIQTTLRLKEGSDVTIIIPEDQLEVVERTGVVIFVNQKDPNDILEKRQNETNTQGLQGYDVNAILQIDPDAVFNVIVDERSGDNLRLQGEADLNIIMNPNGEISLTGEYEVRSGHYELNLFGLVDRRFEIGKGSTIIWRGDPLDATLDFRAIYTVKTSASDLMSTRSAAGPESQSSVQYRQALPFLVYLNIEGEILRPEISFGLDMPEQSRGALGGNVYSSVQAINEEEDELNRQVFSLLVLNQFYPSGGSDGSSGGSVSLARSSVSQILSNQMNTFSDRLFGDSGFSVDFGVDSYTDYRTGKAADRTDLNVAAQQRLFNDRLVVQVGSQVKVEGNTENVSQENALFGDVSLDYLLTPNGRWRATAFRKNQFESVIDGQLIITGLGLIFNREFNRFFELWRGVDAEEERRKKRMDQEKEEEDLSTQETLP
jgi:translocation and assembly module TamB